MLDLLKGCYNCFWLSLVKKHLDEDIIIYYNFSYLNENSFRNLSSWLHTQHSYFFLLNLFLLLSTFSVFLKSLNIYFFRWLAYKSLLSRFSVLIVYIIWFSSLFSTSSCFPRFSWSRFFRIQVFVGPGFSGSGFRVQGLGPGFRSSRDFACATKSC